MILFIILIIIILTIVYLTKCRNIDDFSNLKNQNTYTIGVPCITRDVPKLDNLIKSINKQTHLPLEVVISLSGTDQHYGQKVEDHLNEISKVPVRILTSEEMKFAGENRNIVLDNARGNIVIFIDADDIMHPQRVEIVDKIFKKANENGNNPIGLLHGYYFYDESVDPIDSNNEELWDGKQLYKFFKDEVVTKKRFILFQKSRGKNLHHGHIVVRKNVPIRFKPVVGEDVYFIRDILNKYGDSNDNLYYTTSKLTIYNERDRKEAKDILNETKKDRN